jgi:hypothetical protein
VFVVSKGGGQVGSFRRFFLLIPLLKWVRGDNQYNHYRIERWEIQSHLKHPPPLSSLIHLFPSLVRGSKVGRQVSIQIVIIIIPRFIIVSPGLRQWVCTGQGSHSAGRGRRGAPPPWNARKRVRGRLLVLVEGWKDEEL